MKNSFSNEKTSRLMRHFECYGQEQVFQFWDKLNPEQRSHLFQQAEKIDLQKISEYIRSFLFPEHNETESSEPTFAPAPYLKFPHDTIAHNRWDEAYTSGEAILASGKVAIFTAAGGQGSRLGLETPKGTLGVTPVLSKSLFQIFAEKIRFAEKRYGHTIHWIVMVNPQNYEATEKFFQKNDFFELKEVHFLKQSLIPSINFYGKIMLEAIDCIALHPNGHGGAIRELVDSGIADRLQKSNIDVISYHQIDNPLANIIDPYFIGFHTQHKSQMSSRVVRKKHPDEPVGTFAMRNGRLIVQEYSHHPTDMTSTGNSAKKFKSDAANIALHLFERDFIQKIGATSNNYRLPVYAIPKKIKTIDAHGNSLYPETPNGIKFESFIFDALPLAFRPLLVEGKREHIFSPIKNAQGLDSLQTCQQDQLRLFAHWLLKAGVTLAIDSSGLPPFPIEISPLFADNERIFLEKWIALKTKPMIKTGLCIE